jgi:arginyl-tRNA synthetase
MNTQDALQQLVQKALDSLGLDTELKVKIEYPRDAAHGDYATNAAMQLAKPLGKNPREIAQMLVEAIVKTDGADQLLDEAPEIAGPGFINFWVHQSVLTNAIDQAIEQADQFGYSNHLKGKKMMVEFAHPNTHKAFHIGHFRNISLGEAIVRLLESQGAEVFRANYQGDVGPHVAKCLWGMMNAPEGMHKITSLEDAKAFEAANLGTPEKKNEYLGKAYANGGVQFKEDPEVEAEIRVINKQIYDKDPEIMPLWELTKQWSLDYFNSVYKRVGTHFDRCFMESEMYERGKKIVQDNMEFFEESEGAIVFPGEKYGLHTRVFITKEGNATYEGKEMANIVTEREAYDFDKKVHVVANEQATYFEVVFKASELIDPTLIGKQHHVSYGMVNLSTGKMSSRTGDVVIAEDLLNDAKKRVTKILEESERTEKEKAEIAEKVALGAVKFTMLVADSKRDIAFDMENSLRLDGASGPYIQYGYARISSVLDKVDSEAEPDYTSFNERDWQLSKQLLRFQEEVSHSAADYTTHNTAHYLLGLVAEFSRWYENNRVSDAEPGLKSARVQLLMAIKQVIHNGLFLLGIETIERM